MNELEWLADRRPETAAADEETTAYARTALLAYAVRGGERVDGAATARVESAGTARVVAGARRPGQATRPRPTGGTSPVPAAAPPQRHAGGGRRRSGARGRAGLYTLAAAVFAVAIVVVAGALPSGDGPAKQIARHIGAPTVAEAAPLVKLVKSIQQQPAPTGDATLVLRSHDFPDAKDFTGADLYLDDGRYFYGMTLDELKAQAKFGDIGEGTPKRERQAAIAANELDAAAARKAMIAATWAGGHEPTEAELANLKKRAAAIRKLKRPSGPTPPPASQLSIDNNRIWMGSMDTLISGAGDAKVRAGVMKLLGTIEAVKVTDRGDTLEITNTDFPDGYRETLIVDAKTGVIQKMIGGDAGKAPSVIVTYEIKRVDAKDILDR